MQKFTIKIDLSGFFNDERKQVLMLVDPEWKHVEKLQDHVKSILKIDDVKFITKDDYYIPPQESIEVIKYIDSIKAFVTRKDKKLSPIEISQSIVNNGSVKKKRKLSTIDGGLASSTPNNAKRSKNNTFSALIKESNVNTSGTPGVDKNKSTTTTSEIQIAERSIDSVLETSTCTNKSKRMRNKNKSKQEDDAADVTKNESSTISHSHAKPKSTKSQIQERTNNSLHNDISKKKRSTLLNNNIHIYFDETEEDNVQTTFSNDKNEENLDKTADAVKLPETKIIFRCALTAINSDKPRTLVLKPESNKNCAIISIPTSNSAQKTVTEPPNTSSNSSRNVDVSTELMQKNDSLVNVAQHEQTSLISAKNTNESSIIPIDEDDTRNCSDHVDNDSEVIELNESEDDASSIDQHSCLNLTPNPLTVEKVLPQAKTLEKLPNVGDILVFKLFKNIKTKIVSDYISGRCEYINRRAKSIKVFIIDCKTDVESITAKYSCNLDDSRENMKYLLLKISDMIEPKVLCM